jgi:mannose-6-phosphate isomerase-like protein (cupin superfamily)
MKTTAVLVLAFAIGAGSALLGQAPAQPAQKPPVATQQPAQKPPAVAQPPAQTPPAQPAPMAPKPQTPTAPPKAAAKPAASTRLALTVFVSDTTGAPIQGVHVTADGPIPREGTTSREGSVTLQGLKAGQYRLRFEAERFVTLEKELALKASEEVEATLSKAMAGAKPADPVAPPAQKPAGPAVSVPPADPNATVEVVSVVDWLAKNKLPRGEPTREGIVARTGFESAALLQIREAVRDRSHADADEVIYVINGTATLSSKGRQQQLETGALLLIPRGVTVTIENRGREPLWALSVIAPSK